MAMSDSEFAEFCHKKGIKNSQDLFYEYLVKNAQKTDEIEPHWQAFLSDLL